MNGQASEVNPNALAVHKVSASFAAKVLVHENLQRLLEKSPTAELAAQSVAFAGTMTTSSGTRSARTCVMFSGYIRWITLLTVYFYS